MKNMKNMENKFTEMFEVDVPTSDEKFIENIEGKRTVKQIRRFANPMYAMSGALVAVMVVAGGAGLWLNNNANNSGRFAVLATVDGIETGTTSDGEGDVNFALWTRVDVGFNDHEYDFPTDFDINAEIERKNNELAAQDATRTTSRTTPQTTQGNATMVATKSLPVPTQKPPITETKPVPPRPVPQPVPPLPPPPGYNPNVELSARMQHRIRQDYMKFFWNMEEIDWEWENSIWSYHGTYNGNVVVHMNVMAGQMMTRERVGDFDFIYSSTNQLTVWNDGKFYSLTESFDNGLLFVQDIAKIYESYNQPWMDGYRD
jgi:hypothetical protein